MNKILIPTAPQETGLFGPLSRISIATRKTLPLQTLSCSSLFRCWLLAVLLCLIGRVDVWAYGENTSYVLTNTGSTEVTVMDWWSSNKKITYSLSGSGYIISVDHKKLWSSTDDITVKCYSTSDGSGATLYEYKLSSSTSYKTTTIDISDYPTIRSIVFNGGGTERKYIRNVSVTRATTLSNISAQDMGESKPNTSVTKSIAVDYNNTTYPQQITGTCTDPAFTVTSVEAGETGTANITITFTPTEVRSYNGTVTLNMNGAQTSFNVSGKGIDGRVSPTFTWNLTQAYLNRTYKAEDIFQSTNTETAYTITSNDETMAKMVGNDIAFQDKEGQVSFNVTQPGNDNWMDKTETFTVNVSKAQNHLPVTITADNQAALVQGSYTWSNGIRLGNDGGGLNWDDKAVIIPFEGIPLNIRCSYEAEASGVTGLDWYIQESTNGTEWDRIWTSTSKNGEVNQEISPASRYVRLCYSGNFGGVFRNITITERRHLTATPAEIDFGTQMEEDDVPAQTFTLQHCNAGYGVTVTSSNPELFTITPSLLTSTGGDLMGEETISVKFNNLAVGQHTATITIADPNGQNDPVMVNVTGSTRACRITLNPTEAPSYETGLYKGVTLARTLKTGFSTLALPYSTSVSEIAPGQEETYVAQLALVTYNKNDGYSLYFRKVEDGTITANQPYLIHMSQEIENPAFTNVTALEPQETDITTNGWTMSGNYTPALPMEGLYGIAGGKLCKGAAGSTLNAYTAYFTAPASAKNARVRIAVENTDGTTTWIGELSEDGSIMPEAIYSPDGMRQTKLRKGVNIVRQKDGTTRKMWK